MRAKLTVEFFPLSSTATKIKSELSNHARRIQTMIIHLVIFIRMYSGTVYQSDHFRPDQK
jgi:hypothetical protein